MTVRTRRVNRNARSVDATAKAHSYAPDVRRPAWGPDHGLPLRPWRTKGEMQRRSTPRSRNKPTAARSGGPLGRAQVTEQRNTRKRKEVRSDYISDKPYGVGCSQGDVARYAGCDKSASQLGERPDAREKDHRPPAVRQDMRKRDSARNNLRREIPIRNCGHNHRLRLRASR